ncbi:MAG: hypothetical protein A3H69_00375 [Candidatus Sungbacteria bacterium RIFCSPLOWO2_02_FULL_47_9]|nr:MAG: hypothetical protein A3H69_00375 [Candidatus Sungbacteria bacterium RIFCSPLOWO2_02_FULL_47_9]
MKRKSLIIGLIILAVAFALYRSRLKTGLSREEISQKNKTAEFSQTMAIERVELKTDDGVKIVGDFYRTPQSATTGIIYLHMMPSARQSYVKLAENLQQAGYPGIAIDLRGHGESEGGPNGYKSFKDEEHQKSVADVRGAGEFLASKGVKTLYIIGASIGANLALEYLAEAPEAKAATLISPGLDYRGVKTEPFLKTVSSGKAVYLIAADDDAYSAGTVRKLFDEIPRGVSRNMTSYREGGHGTALFQSQPELVGEIERWVQSLKK